MDQTTDFEFEGSVREDVDVTDTTEIEKESTTKASVETDTNEELAQEQEEVSDEKPRDKNVQALDAERARRKRAEAEIKELKAQLEGKSLAEKAEEKVNAEKDNLKALLMKDDLIDEEVADRLMETFGNKFAVDAVTTRERQEEESFDAQLDTLMSNDVFCDANTYRDSIKSYMEKGLDIESAYFASAGKNKLALMRKELEVEAEQRLLNSNARIEDIDVGSAQSKGEAKHTSYTKLEQRLANESGFDAKEVRKRMNANTLDEFLNL